MDQRRFLNQLRLLQGDVPLEVFAPRVGISPSHLSRLYRGKRSPGMKVVRGALQAFPNVNWEEWGLRAPDDGPSSPPDDEAIRLRNSVR